MNLKKKAYQEKAQQEVEDLRPLVFEHCDFTTRTLLNHSQREFKNTFITTDFKTLIIDPWMLQDLLKFYFRNHLNFILGIT